MSRLFNWIVLGWLIMLAVAMLGVTGNRQPEPQTVQASSLPDDATHACQVVIDRLGMVQAIVVDEVRSGSLKPLAALRECTRQQHQAAISACPGDFQVAEMRFVGAEDSLLRHAQMSSEEKADAAAMAAFDVLTHKSGYRPTQHVSDELKQDLDNVQLARVDLIQAALNYGVK
jgi:hypothetical protein